MVEIIIGKEYYYKDGTNDIFRVNDKILYKKLEPSSQN